MKSEAKTAYKELADVQQELLTSNCKQIEMFQTRMQKALKNELETNNDAVKKSCREF